MTAPAGGTHSPAPGRHARPLRWVVLALVLALVAVAAVLWHGSRVVDGRGTAADRSPSPLSGSVAPGFDLAGEWSGGGTLSRCAGLAECARTRPVSLTIECSGQSCAVTPFDSSWGRPRLTVRGGSYQAAGPVPAALAPTCDGVPTSSAVWRLQLTVLDGRLVGSYAESTLQGFDCGATGVAWDLSLDRT